MTTRELLSTIGTKPVEQTRTHRGYAVLRVSTDSQDEKAQRRDIEQACERHNLEILRWHHEREKANDLESRRAFAELIDAAKADPECEFIICRDASRFMRDRYGIEQAEEELVKNGVRLFDNLNRITWADDLSVDAIWSKNIMRAQAEGYSAQVRDWTMKSMIYVATQRDPETDWSYHLGGVPLFGYKRHKTQTGLRDRRGNEVMREIWILDDTPIAGAADGVQGTSEAGIPKWQLVRRIWLDWYCRDRYSLDKIALLLSSMGVRGARGKPISVSTVNQWRQPVSLLTYAGWYIWNKNVRKRLGRRVQGKSIKPPHGWRWVEKAHPAIFSLEEVEQIDAEAQRRTEQYQRAGKRGGTSRTYLLSGGLTKCEACGSNVIGFNDRQWCYYLCGSHNYRKGFGCGPRFGVRKDELEKAVFETALRAIPFTPKRAETVARQLNQRMLNLMGNPESRRRELITELSRIEEELRNLVGALKRGIIVDEIESEAKRLEARKSDIERELQKDPLAEVPRINAEELMEFHSQLADCVQSKDVQQRKEVVRNVCQEIRFDPYNRVVKVAYRLPTHHFKWYPHGESNPGYRAENPAS